MNTKLLCAFAAIFACAACSTQIPGRFVPSALRSTQASGVITLPPDHVYVSDSVHNDFDVVDQLATSTDTFEYRVATGDASPLTIALNPANGDVYFTNDGKSIERYAATAISGPTGSVLSPTPLSATAPSILTSDGSTIHGIAFDGAGHAIVTTYGVDSAGQPVARARSFAVADLGNAAARPDGQIGVASYAADTAPTLVATDVLTHTVFVSDLHSPYINEYRVSSTQPLDDSVPLHCTISVPAQPTAHGNYVAAMTFDLDNKLLYATLQNGTILAFSDCSSTPSRSITGVVAAGVPDDGWDVVQMAADQIDGNVAVYARSTYGNTVLTFGDSANGAIWPRITTVPGNYSNHLGIAFGP